MIFEEKLIFFPVRFPEGDWKPKVPSGFSLEDVFIELKGYKIHAWYIQPEKLNFDGALLLCHGNAGNLTTRLPKALAIATCGIPVLLFDYRGYGKSDSGPVNEKSIYADSQAAYNWLISKGFSQNKVIIHGISLGGGAACFLAEKNKPLALSLESTFTSIPDMCKVVYPFLPKFIVSTKFNNLERISKLSIPIHIIHGTADELIPISMGDILFKAASEPKFFVSVEGAGHGDLLDKAGSLFGESINKFLDFSFNQ